MTLNSNDRSEETQGKEWSSSLANRALQEIRKAYETDPESVRVDVLKGIGYQFRKARDYSAAIEINELLVQMKPDNRRYPRNIRTCRVEQAALEGDFEACVDGLANVRAHDISTVVKNCLINFVMGDYFDLAENLLEHDVLKGDSSDGSRKMYWEIAGLSKPAYLLALAKHHLGKGNRDAARETILSALSIITEGIPHMYLYNLPDGNSVIRLAAELCDPDKWVDVVLPLKHDVPSEDSPYSFECVAQCLARSGKDDAINQAIEVVDIRYAAELFGGAALGHAEMGNKELAVERVNQFLGSLVPPDGYTGTTQNGFLYVSREGFRSAAKAAFLVGELGLRDKVIETHFEFLKNDQYRDQYPFLMDLCLEVDAINQAKRAAAEMSWSDRQAESGRIAIKMFQSGIDKHKEQALELMEERTAEVTHNKDSMFVNAEMTDHSWSRTMVAQQWLEIGEFERASAIKDLVFKEEQEKFLQYLGVKLAEVRFFGDDHQKYLDWAMETNVEARSHLERAHKFVGLHRGFTDSENPG